MIINSVISSPVKIDSVFDTNVNTVPGSIKTQSKQGGGSEGNTNISVIENDVSFGEFDVNLDFDEVKYTSDFILSGFTDEVTFYDSASERITMDKELTPLQVTFPSGYIQSLKYNSVIKYDSKTVTLYNWEDGFTFPLIDYTDDGSLATLKMYAIYTESGKCEMVLLDRVMTDADLPTDYESFLYIKDVTIPAHEIFQRSQNSIPDYDNPNYNVIGSMTIADGVASGFTNDNYIDTKTSIPMSSASNMEIFIKMNIPSAYNNYAIIGNSTDSAQAGGFVLRTTGSTRVYFWSTSNKSNWNISDYFDTWIDLQDGTNYIKIVFNGSRYTFYHSTDNETWSEGNSIDNSTPLADFYPRFGMADSSNIPLPGSIDFNETYFKINDEIVWKAYNQTHKWYCKTLHYDTTYTDEVPVNIWFNKAYYTTNGKYIESRNAYIIDYETDPNGCLLDYTDDGFGDLLLNLYAVEFDNSGEYKLLLSDKNASTLENYGDITNIETIATNVDLQSHFNSEYIDEGEYELKDQFQSFSYEDETTEPSRFIVLENEELGLSLPKEELKMFTNVGGVSLENKIASDFSESKYILPKYTLAPNTSLWVIHTKFKLNSNSSNRTLIGSYYNENGFENILLRVNSGYMMFYISTQNGGWDISQNTGTYYLSTNVEYEMEAGFDGSYYYTKFKAPGDTNWTTDLNFYFNYNYIGAGKFIIGAHNYSSGSVDTPFSGIVNLDETYVKINDYIIWKPYIKDSYIKFEEIGSPTIVNKVASNFSKTNYLVSNIQDVSYPFDVYIKFTTPSTLISGGEKIFAIGDFKTNTPSEEYKNVELFINRSGSAMYAKTTNNNDISNVLDTSLNNGATPISANTTYYVKIGCDGTDTYAYYSTTGYDNMTLMASVNATTEFPSTCVYLGYEPLIAPNNTAGKIGFRGSIDLSETYVKLNNKIIWSPYKVSSKLTQNFEIQGNVTITNGIAEGFTSSDYLYTSDFNFADATSTYEVVFKVLFTGDGEGTVWTQPVGNSYFGTFVSASRSSGYCLSGNNWDYSDLSWSGSWLEQNQWGYIKYTKDGSTYSLYTSLDNENWTYRSSFGWGNAIQNDGHAFTIGYSVNRGDPFPGKVNLNECYVKFGDEIVWTPYSSNISEFENTELAPYTRTVTPYDVENFDIVGNPTISNKVVSNFSYDNNIIPSYNFNDGMTTANTWEWVFKGTVGTKTSTTWNSQAFYADGTNYENLIGLNGDYIPTLRLGSSTSSYSICELDGQTVFSVGDTIWLKAVFTGSEYQLYSKKNDDADWTLEGSVADSTKLSNKNNDWRIGVSHIGSGSSFNYPWQGTIDLNDCYIKIDNSIVWQPYTQEYQYDYRGSLVNYTDDGSANTIKAYKVDYTSGDVKVILTNDTTYTDQDIDSKTYLADIVIPEHGVYTYGPKQIVENYENEKLTDNGAMSGSSPGCEADSYYSDNYPYKTFDKSEDYYSRWLSSDTGGTHWITYYTPTAIRVDKIDIVNHPEGYATFQYKVLVSNDNTTWTEIKSGINFNSSGSGKWSISDFTNNNTDIKYIKILSTMGYDSSRLGFKEIYIYGYTTTSGYGWILDDESSS